MKDVNPLFSLDGKVSLITGGSRGIGRAISLFLAQSGSDVVVMARDKSAGEKIAGDINALGVKGIHHQGDVALKEDIDRVVGQVIDSFGKIDVLVNNAAICRNVEAEKMSWEDWYDVIHVNLSSVFLMCQAVGRQMIKQGYGSIINVSSISGEIVNIPQPQCSYNASKAGVSHLTKSLAIEWVKYGVRVNAIAPGYTETDMTRPALEMEWGKKWQELSPVQRMGQPEEIAGIAVYLASDNASYTTGAIFNIDGAYTAF